MSWGQALSGIFGSISLTAWICLLVSKAWYHFLTVFLSPPNEEVTDLFPPAASPVDCQLQGKERRGTEHGIFDRLALGRCV